jgi:hypothetical protein
VRFIDIVSMVYSMHEIGNQAKITVGQAILGDFRRWSCLSKMRHIQANFAQVGQAL